MVINKSSKIGLPSDLRRVHRSLVLKRIFTVSRDSRAQLAEETGLSTMAISRIIRELISANLIEEVGKKDRKGNPGRRRTNLQINAQGAYVIGLVLSAFGHEVAIFDAVGAPMTSKTLSFDSVRTADEAVEVASNTILALIDDAQVDKARVLGIGIAISAFVESETGSVIQAPYLGWKEVELGQRIRELTELPVIAENITDAINMAEFANGATTGIEDVFLVHQSVTCGASYTHQGRIVHGANFSAGQIGHLRVEESSLICSCGGTNCLNTHVSGWSILANLSLIKSHKFETRNIETYAKALAVLVDEDPDQDTVTGQALFQAGRRLAETLQQIALIVDPQAIVVAGKLSEATAYIDGCQSVWTDATTSPHYTPPKLIVGRVAAIGAAGFLALDRFVYSPQLAIDRLIDNVAPPDTESYHVGR